MSPVYTTAASRHAVSADLVMCGCSASWSCNEGTKAWLAVHPQRFRRHLSHTWLARGGAGEN